MARTDHRAHTQKGAPSQLRVGKADHVRRGSALGASALQKIAHLQSQGPRATNTRNLIKGAKITRRQAVASDIMYPHRWKGLITCARSKILKGVRWRRRCPMRTKELV